MGQPGCAGLGGRRCGWRSLPHLGAEHARLLATFNPALAYRQPAPTSSLSLQVRDLMSVPGAQPTLQPLTPTRIPPPRSLTALPPAHAAHPPHTLPTTHACRFVTS